MIFLFYINKFFNNISCYINFHFFYQILLASFVIVIDQHENIDMIGTRTKRERNRNKRERKGKQHDNN